MTLAVTAVETGGAAGARKRTEERFWAEMESLRRRYIDLWLDCDDEIPVLGEQRSRSEQRRSARAAARLIDELAERIETYPEQPDARPAWRAVTRERVQRFGEAHLGWPDGYRRLLLGDDYFDATLDFARRARRLDPELELGDLFQALRNAWIAASIQMLLDLEVRCSPAVFAYSMLYPYTDNTLDDPRLPPSHKHRLNRGLERRLRGEAVTAEGPAELRIYELVAEIERQFPRPHYPEVHASLQAIHRAQVASLGQQVRPLHVTELLAISVEKGGTSVLADAYLVAGHLDPAEADFFFGYGVLLQLLDDLQDVVEDRRAGHLTLFSRLPEAEPMDSLVSRLHAFIEQALGAPPRFAAPVFEERLDLIRRNCIALMVGAIAENPTLCSRAFTRRLEDRWPLRFAAMRRLRKRARKVYDRRLRTLQRARRAASLLELFGDGAESRQHQTSSQVVSAR